MNPYDYLIETNAQNEFVNLSSSLNTVFDQALKTLFSNKKLSLQGVASDDDVIPADVYTVVSTGAQPYPGSAFSVPALQFKGQTTGNVFNIFNPVGLTVYVNPKNQAPITGTIVNTGLTFSSPLPAKTLVPNMYVQGAGTNPATTIVSLVKNKQGNITGATLNQTLGSPAANSIYVFSKVPNLFFSSGAMVFGCVGVFADAKVQTADADQQAVLANLENQIVSALNRGVANLAPASGNPGHTSAYWNTETKWYPAGRPQNLFSLFMHTRCVGSPGTPIFVRPNSPAKNARGQIMGMAYGFAYDENPAAVPGPGDQPEVPSKFDPTPAGTTTMTVTLGPW